MNLGCELLLELVVGFEGEEVVTAGGRGEIAALEAIDFGVVLAAPSGGDAAAIGLLQKGELELVADPADADFGADQRYVGGEPVARYR